MENNDGIFNLRGCGNGGNNSAQIALNNARDEITFTPRLNYFGRCQFAFYLADAYQRGQYVVVTVDVEKDACFEISSPDELVINGSFEEGSEVRNTLANNDITLVDQVDAYNNYFIATAMTDGMNYYSWGWNDAVIRGDWNVCIDEYSIQFPSSYVLPSNNQGDRYNLSSYYSDPSGVQESFNLTLVRPIENCEQLVFNCDVLNQTPEDGPLNLYVKFHNSFTEPIVQIDDANEIIVFPANSLATWQHIELPFVYEGTNPSSYIQIGAIWPEGNANSTLLVDNISIVPDYSNVDEILATLVDLNMPNCNNLYGGSALIAVNGGICPYSYQWDNDGTSDSDDSELVLNLESGTYTCVVTDAMGNSTSISITVPEYTPLSANVNMTNVITCIANYSIVEIIPAGGSANYLFQWNNEFISNSSQQFYSSGEYTCLVQDDSGCELTVTFTVENAPTLSLNVVSNSNVSCFGYGNGSIEVQGSGGVGPPYVYQWNTEWDESLITDLLPGLYTCYLYDATNCFAVVNVEITEPEQLTASLTSITAASCPNNPDGAASLSFAGGSTPYTFSWTGPDGYYSIDENPTNMYSGAYVATVTDANNCNYSIDVNVGVIGETCCPLPGLDNTITYSNDCFNLPGAPIHFFNATTTEGATFLWDFGNGQTSTEQNPSNTYLTAGTYSVSVSINAGGCDPLVGTISIIIEPFTQSGTISIATQTQANAFFTNNASFGGDIIFQANITPYTISNRTLYFGPGVDIFINEGATVNFIKCVVTSCSNWNGFDVKSDGSNNIPPGKLTFDATGSEVSEIRHAQIAIDTRDERIDVQSIPAAQRRAGQLNCRRTIFTDNKMAVRVQYAYQTPYQVNAHFHRCTFTVTDELATHFPDNIGQYNQFWHHVSFNYVYKYNFAGCIFKNEMTENENIDIARWQNRGSGIAARSSNFHIDKANATQYGQYHYGLFQGLDKGITAYASTVRVSGQTFKKNHIGALMLGSNLSRFYNNTFRIGEQTGISYLDEQEYYGSVPSYGGNGWGLYEDPFTSYEGIAVYKGDLIEIAENTFTGYPEANGGIADTWPRIGTRIRATDTEDMVVYNNNYNRLMYANLANADNAGGTGTNGLRYICNTNSQNWQDFTNTDFLGLISPLNQPVIGDLQMEPEGTFPLQQVDWPTGNTFSTDNDATATHFRNEGDEIEIYLKSNLALENPTDNMGIANINISNAYHSCPNLYTTGVIFHSQSEIIAMLGQSEISQADANQLRYIYLLLIDGGSTEDLQQYVEDTWGAQLWSTREHLLNLSPYLSNTVLLSVLDNTAVYPHAIAFEIMMANPEALSNKAMVDHLSEKVDPMPEYMIDLLLACDPGPSGRTALEKSLAEKRTMHINAASRALWAMMDYDDDTYTREDINTVVGNMATLNTEMMTVDAMLNDGLVSDSYNHTAGISSSVPLGKDETKDYAAFQTWVDLRISMINGGREWETMDATDIAILETLVMELDTYAGAMAMSVLNQYTETDYFIPPAFGGGYTRRRESISMSELSEQLLDIYPNPADYLVTISIEEPLPTMQLCVLVVTDIFGQQVANTSFNPLLRQIQLNTKDWSNGLYTFKIIIPNSPIQLNGKLEVIH